MTERSAVDLQALNLSPITPVLVLVVQDHPLLASAIARVLDSQEDIKVCGIARGGDEAARVAANEKPQVALMDFLLPDMSGPVAAAKIRSVVPSAAIVFHSAEESEGALLDAIDAGATAYLTKSASADQIVEAVRRASLGEVLIPVSLFAKAIARQRKVVIDKQAREKLFAEFTPRELDVLRLLAEGHDTATLARRLGIAPHTVEWHVSHLIEKLQVHSKLQAVIAAARAGLIEL
ncbi:MAG TPA: response regulator transcription factor [Candidatus Dormibacteraeota bacterium]|nr:response regulator transcription factor [Candidatus Dormibacteraeota bacterium]